MKALANFLESHLMTFAGRIAEQKHLQAVRDGLILAMPLLIIGSVFLILGNLPIPGYNEWMTGLFGREWSTKLQYPVGATFDIMALIANFGIAYRLAEKYKVDPLAAAAISVASFLLATPYKTMFTPPGAKEAIEVGGVIPTALMGSKGLFVAMLLALLSTEIYRMIIQKNIVIKLPDSVPPAVSRSFVALIPAFAVLTVVWLLRIGIENTSFESVHNIVAQLLSGPLNALGGSLFGILIAVLVQQMLWSTGIHGASLVGAVMGPTWLTLLDQNRIAFQAGQEPPNVVTSEFVEILINTGGSGATLALVVLMLFRARSQQAKNLGKLSIGAGIFNINEPVLFGMPIVMNPMMIVPFILAPVAMVLVSYFAMSTGLVAKSVGANLPWTTPILVSGFLMTGGKISGAVLQLVNFFVALAIYYPFFRIWDKQKLNEEEGVMTEHEGVSGKTVNL